MLPIAPGGIREREAEWQTVRTKRRRKEGDKSINRQEREVGQRWTQWSGEAIVLIL